MGWNEWMVLRSESKKERCEYIANSIIERDDLKRKNRKRDFVYRRMVLYYILYFKMKAGFSTTDLGRMFNRDHVTILNGLRQFEDLKVYGDVRKIYNEYIKEFE